MPTANEQYQAAKASNNVSFNQEWLRTQKALAKMTAGERAAALGFSSMQSGEFVLMFDALGQARARLGHQSDGTVALIYGNGPPPPIPSDPIVSARQLAILVYWDGKFTGGYAKPGDFARCDVHMSDDSADFLPDGTTLVGSLFGEGATLLAADNSTHYVKIVAVSNADIASAASAGIAVLPLPAEEISSGAIGTEQLAADFAFISRLVVGDINGCHLELEGRQGMPPGMALYDETLTPTLMLDAETGDVSMRGELRTADTGERLILREDPLVNDLRAYPMTGSFYATLYSRTFNESGTDYGAWMLRAGAGDAAGGVLMNTYLWVTHKAVQIYRGDHLGSRASCGFTLDDNGVTMASRFTTTGSTITTGQVATDHCHLEWGNNLGYIYIDSTSTRIGSASFTLDFWLSSGTYHWNMQDRLLWYHNNNCGVQFNGSGFDIYNPSSGAYLAVGASAFVVQSARRTKQNIRPLPFDPEQVIVNAPVSMWQRTAEDHPDHPDPRDYLGPMAEDVPALLTAPTQDTETGELTVPGIDLAAQVAVLWAAVGRHVGRLDALEHRPPKEPNA